jgi:hypothetical protein
MKERGYESVVTLVSLNKSKMTNFTELCIQIALITNSLLAIAAIIVLISKNKRYTHRFKDRVWDNIDELKQRITELEEKVFPERTSNDTSNN